jgi:cytochrome c oxidase subunit 2
MNPQAKIVNGFGPIMPSFQGQLSEEQLLQLVAYIKSLSAPKTEPPTAKPPPPSARPSATPASTPKT